MNLSGETEIAASRQRVWDTISNPNRAAASSSSGQAQIEKIDDRHYKVTVAAPGMPMGVTLDMQVTERPSKAPLWAARSTGPARSI